MEKIWLKHYPKGMPEMINTDQYHSLIDLFEENVKKYSDKPAFEFMGHRLTYQEINAKSNIFAAYLQKTLKLKKGDRFAIMLPNCLQFFIALFGALRAGLVIVTVNPLYTTRELDFQLKNSDAKAMLVLNHFAEKAQKVMPKTKLEHLMVTGIADMLSQPKRFIIDFVLKYIKKQVPDYREKDVIFFNHALSEGEQLDFSKINIKPDDLAFLQYTGGTTGVPKGAMLTHKNIVSNVSQCITWVKPALTEGSEKIIVALPLYHIFSLTICGLSFLSIGGMGILIPNPRDLVNFVKVLKKTKPTVFVGINTLFSALMLQKKFKALDFSDLKLTISGGMALQEAVAERWKKRVGDRILEGYGLTEASPVVCVNSVEHCHYTGSIGFPLPSTDISIRNDAGEEMPIGEIGEFWVKGDQVMQGYWESKDETNSALTQDGWLKTGDMAYVDEKGLVYLVDRKKDMIIVSGFNVYPNELEAVIASHPDVLEAGVVGVPDAEHGELIKAVVVRKKTEVTQKDILDFCKQNLTAYKIPKIIEFKSELPKSPVGKILRKELRG